MNCVSRFDVLGLESRQETQENGEGVHDATAIS